MVIMMSRASKASMSTEQNWEAKIAEQYKAEARSKYKRLGEKNTISLKKFYYLSLHAFDSSDKKDLRKLAQSLLCYHVT